MLDINCLASSIGNIFHSVSILLINSFKFDGFRIDTLILRSAQRFSVGFVPELKATRGNYFISCLVFQSLDKLEQCLGSWSSMNNQSLLRIEEVVLIVDSNLLW